MKILLLPLLLATALAHADEVHPCLIDGWLKIRPVPNAAGDSYGNPDWPEKIHLYPASTSRDISDTLPDAMQGTTWDYLRVSLSGYASDGRFPVKIEAYGSPDNVPRVSGWLDAKHIGFTLQSRRLYAAPDAKSAIKLALSDWLGERGDVILRDCQNEWVQIDYRQRERRNPDGSIAQIPDSEQQTLESVWARGVCGNLETTCDMPDVDQMP
ncbi:MAG: hypothetical protein Q4A06_01800 [Cardiobacteriaceae bacterium]|nr:hypothetical protein [Cardiobacteriaceae bacterium]